MPAFIRLALTAVAVKNLFTNFPHSPLAPAVRENFLTKVAADGDAGVMRNRSDTLGSEL